MTANSNYIRTGFYDDFKGYDTVLISVDINGLLELENVFLQLSQGRQQLDFSELQFLDKKYHVDITAYNDAKNLGLRQVDKNKFEWRLTKDMWHHFKELLSSMTISKAHGHHYLDADEGDIDGSSLQVVFSLDEYSLSFWEEHFATRNS